MAKRLAPAIATLTLNPAVDLSFEVDRVRSRMKLRCHDLRRDPGGGGVNVARVLRRLGGEALAIFPAGGPDGERLQVLLKRERIPVLAIPIAGETREDFNVEDRASGEQYRFVTPGPRLRPAEIGATLGAWARAPAQPEILVASGSLPGGAPLTAYAGLAKATKAAGVKLALDASGPALRYGLAAGVWLVKPNLDELEELHGAPLTSFEARLRACEAIVESNCAQVVALSMGAEGALLVTAGEAWRAAAPALTPASTIGAGDSFMGGLVYALAAGHPFAEALRWAVAAGSAALLAPGTQLCRASDVQALLPRVAVAWISEDVATAPGLLRAFG